MSSNRPDWAPKRLRDLHGMEVVTRYEMKNAYMVIPAGTRVTVHSGTAWHKLNIVGTKCECCGVSPSMSRVHVNELAPARPIETKTPAQLSPAAAQN
ncbi:hypothetical protein ACVIGB_000538 [Bradyrhizobium sp. USDA 4341]